MHNAARNNPTFVHAQACPGGNPLLSIKASQRPASGREDDMRLLEIHAGRGKRRLPLALDDSALIHPEVRIACACENACEPSTDVLLAPPTSRTHSRQELLEVFGCDRLTAIPPVVALRSQGPG